MIASSFDTRPSRYLYEAQPVARQNYVDNGYDRGTTSRTQYVVRPRNNSFMADETRRPSNVILDSRSRPAVNNGGRDRPRSPPAKSQRPRDDSDRFLHPAAVGARHDYNHQRHHSATPAEMDRLVVASRGGRERGGYHRQNPSGPKSYAIPVSRPAIRLDDGYSYTGPREQFERDYPAREPQRWESQARRERPVSAVDFPDFKPPSTLRRDMAPPSAASRQFEKIDRLDPGRPDGRSAGRDDFDRSDDFPRRRHSVRAPVVHQKRDEDFLAPKDDFEGKRSSRHNKGRYDDEDYLRIKDNGIRERNYERDRDPRISEPRRQQRSRETSPDRHGGVGKPFMSGPEPRRLPRSRDNSPERPLGKGLAPPAHESRRKPRSRDSSPERSSIGKGITAAGLGGLTAASLATGLKKEKDSRDKDEGSDSEARKERRRRRRRDRERERELREINGTNLEADPTRDRPSPTREEAELASGRREYPAHENSDSESQEKHRKSHRRRKRHRSEKDIAPQEVLEEAGRDRIPPVGPLEAPRDEMRDFDEDPDKKRRSKLEYQSRDRDAIENNFETRTRSPGENEHDRPRRVQVVEPVKEKEPETKPKGILKPPRAVPFPEDPHPTREGVAPLKEAGKDGLPPEARWTKISRMLVNPEALDQAKERYEEREDYVIVLRVISKEEIAKLAEKTREIREARELEWQEELESRKRVENHQHHRHRHDPSDSDSDTDFDEEKISRLAIAPPQHFPPSQGTPPEPRLNQSIQDPLGRSLPDAVPTPALSVVPETYSTNV